MKLSKKQIAATSYAILFVGFAMIFGSENGVMGYFTTLIDLSLKSKIINSLAVFGTACIGVFIWALTTSDRPIEQVATPILFAFFISLALGFNSVDCTVFNFCKQDPAVTKNCSTQHDAKGSYLDCD